MAAGLCNEVLLPTKIETGDLMSRPMRFEDYYGHENIVNLLKTRANDGSLPHFIILYGEEGLGKTALAHLLAMTLTCESAQKPCYQCESCKTNMNMIMDQGKDSPNVFLYRMSVEGGKDAAKELLTHINSCMGSDIKVFIADEAQRMSSAAQDVLLHDTEHLPPKVYIIMCTTDVTSLSKALRSRAVKYFLPHLPRSTMVSLLLKAMRDRNLSFPKNAQAADIIAEVSEYKPREALSILESLGSNRSVSFTELNTTLQLNDVSQFKQLLETFSGSLTEGISTIFSMDVTSQTQMQICRYITECLKYMQGIPVYMFDVTNDLVTDVHKDVLVHFLYYLSSLTTFDTIKFLSAYLMAHPNGMSVAQAGGDKLQAERMYIARQNVVTTGQADSDAVPKRRHRPSAEELLRKSSLLED